MLNKAQQRILKVAEEIFRDSNSVVNISCRQKGCNTWFDIDLHGVRAASLDTAGAAAFVMGYSLAAHHSSHALPERDLKSGLLLNPVIAESNLKCNKKS